MMRIEAAKLEQMLRLQVQPSLDLLSASSDSSAAAKTDRADNEFLNILKSWVEMSAAGGTPAAEATDDAGRSGGSYPVGSELAALLGRTSLRDLLGDESAAAGVASAAAWSTAERTSLQPQAKLAGKSVPDFAVPLIEQASRRFGVDADLVASVIRTESGFRPDAVSVAGAKGLMQLMDGTAKAMGVQNPFDPEQNVWGGTKYLASLLERFDGNTGVALAAYNAGPGRIARLGIATDEDLAARYHLLPQETQNYVRKILG